MLYQSREFLLPASAPDILINKPTRGTSFFTSSSTQFLMVDWISLVSWAVCPSMMNGGYFANRCSRLRYYQAKRYTIVKEIFCVRYVRRGAVAQCKKFCLVTRRLCVQHPLMPLRSNPGQVAYLSLFRTSDSFTKE